MNCEVQSLSGGKSELVHVERVKKFVDLNSVDGGLEEDPRQSTILSSERPEPKEVCENEGTRKIVRIHKKRKTVSFRKTESTVPHQEQDRYHKEAEPQIADQTAYEEELGTEMVEAKDGIQE